MTGYETERQRLWLSKMMDDGRRAGIDVIGVVNMYNLQVKGNVSEIRVYSILGYNQNYRYPYRRLTPYQSLPASSAESKELVAGFSAIPTAESDYQQVLVIHQK